LLVHNSFSPIEKSLLLVNNYFSPFVKLQMWFYGFLSWLIIHHSQKSDFTLIIHGKTSIIYSDKKINSPNFIYRINNTLKFTENVETIFLDHNYEFLSGK
jgi:hypothetical protein